MELWQGATIVAHFKAELLIFAHYRSYVKCRLSLVKIELEFLSEFCCLCVVCVSVTIKL